MKHLKPLYLVLALVSAVGLAYAPTLIVGAPREPSMGFVQKIFYFHVPCAWVCFLSAFVCAAGAIAYLFKRSEAGERLAASAAELTVVFGMCVLVTGPLWARKAWGRWWEWDVRLTSTLLLWMIFIAYLFARKYGGAGGKKLAAGLSIFGAANVPLIYLSVSIWRTIHPKTSVVPTLDPGMRPAFWISMLSFTIFYFVLLGARVRLERARAELDALYLAAEDRGFLDGELA
jgi:heme exporter protein C